MIQFNIKLTYFFLIINSTFTYSQNCDTLFNFGSSDTVRIYTIANNEGYAFGWNSYNFKSFAEEFSSSSDDKCVTGFEIYFYGINTSSSQPTVDFKIWENFLSESSVLVEKSVSLNFLPNIGIYTIDFDCPIEINSNKFFCGITLNDFSNYPGGTDSLGIVSNSLYDITSNTAWQQDESGIWSEMSDFWVGNTSLYIKPVICECSSYLTLEVSYENGNCGFYNSELNLNVIGDYPPFQYSIDGGNNYSYNNQFMGLQNGFYNVSVMDNCFFIRNEDISILCVLNIPSAITPNGDGVNDVWDIVGLQNYPNMRLQIFDRNGILLHNQQRTYTDWDGIYAGKQLPEGDYFYIIDLKNGERPYMGAVSIKF